MKLFVALFVVFAMLAVMGKTTSAERIPYPFTAGGSAYWYYYTKWHVYPSGETCEGKPAGATFFVEYTDASGDTETRMVVCGASSTVAGRTSTTNFIGSQGTRAHCKVTPESVAMLPLVKVGSGDGLQRQIDEYNKNANAICKKYYGANYRLAVASDLQQCFDGHAPQIDSRMQVGFAAAGSVGISSGTAFPLSPDPDADQWGFGLACPDNAQCTGKVTASSDCQGGTLPFLEDGEIINALLSVNGDKYYVPGTKPTDLYKGLVPLLCVAIDQGIQQGAGSGLHSFSSNRVNCNNKFGGAYTASHPFQLANEARGAGLTPYGSAIMMGTNAASMTVTDSNNIIGYDGDRYATLELDAFTTGECEYDGFLQCDVNSVDVMMSNA